MSETQGLCPKPWKTNLRNHQFRLTLGLWHYLQNRCCCVRHLSWVYYCTEATRFDPGVHLEHSVHQNCSLSISGVGALRPPGRRKGLGECFQPLGTRRGVPSRSMLIDPSADAAGSCPPSHRFLVRTAAPVYNCECPWYRQARVSGCKDDVI